MTDVGWAQALQKTSRAVENAFSLRIDDIAAMTAALEKETSDTFVEIGALEQAKDRLQVALQATELPLAITIECAEERQRREGVELVADDVDEQLAEEEALLREIQALFAARVDDATEQLRLLRAASRQLDRDKADKAVAFATDTQAFKIDASFRAIEHHPEEVRVDPESVEVRDWFAFSRENISKAEREQAATAALREAIDAAILASNDRQVTQGNAVDAAFNARLAQYAEAKNQLETDLRKLTDEMKLQGDTLRKLDEEMKGVGGDTRLKVAETRLATRTARPLVEKTRDDVQHALINEVHEISRGVEEMGLRLKEGEEVFRGLRRAEMQLQADIRRKTLSINIDKQCMQRRQQFKYRVVPE